MFLFIKFLNINFCNTLSDELYVTLFRILTKSMIDDEGSIPSSSLDFTDNRVPLGICDTC